MAKDEAIVEVDEEGEPIEEEGEPVGILSAKEVKRIAEYLEEEIEAAIEERAGKEERWKTWRRQADAIPEKEHQDYPWPDAANVAVPLALILTQNMYSYINSTFELRDPLCSIKSTSQNPEEIAQAKVLERYMDLLVNSPFDLNMEYVGPRIRLEGTSMGTAFVKVPWDEERWTFKSTDPETGNLETIDSVLHDGPAWTLIPIENVLYRSGVQNLQRAPWVSHMFDLTESELISRQVQGRYQNVDAVLEHYRTQTEEPVMEEEEERIGIAEIAAVRMVWDFHEVYMKWKLQDSPYMVDIIVTYHKPTGTIMRAEYNELGVRMLEPVNYMFRSFFIDGKGVGWMVEHMQEEVDTIHRMRMNNAHISSVRMFAMKRTAGYRQSEKIYPGKVWKVDDPSKDIVPIQAGEVYPSEMQAEMVDQQYGERAVGFSDAQRGFADMIAKSGGSAQLQMFNAQQGGKLINSITKGMITSFSRLFMYTVFQLVKNKKRVIANEKASGRLSPEDINLLEKALSMKLQDIPKRLKFSVRTTDLDKTFEVRRQNTLTMIQVYGLFWEKIVPLLQAIYNPQTPGPLKEHLIRAFTGSCRLLESTFKFFGEDDVSKYVPDYQRFEALLEMKRMLENAMKEVGGLRGEQQRAIEARAIGAAQAGAGGEGEAGPGPGTLSERRVEAGRGAVPVRVAGGVGPIGP